MSVPRTRFGTQRGTIFQRGKANGGTQVGVGAEFAAQAQESGFGAKVVGIMVESGTAHGTEQDCGGRKACLDCVGGQRIVGGC